MSEVTRLSLKAKAELELTSKAFVEIGNSYIDEALNAQSADEAWQAVLKYRAAARVVADLRRNLDSGLLEQHYEEQNG